MEGPDLEWEEWDGTSPFAVHMAAGSVAGIAEHTVMFPVDTLKTHIQCARCGRRTARCTAKAAPRPVPVSDLPSLFKSVRQQGVGRLWRGVGTMFGGCVPAHALYFSIFEQLRAQLRNTSGGVAVAGAAATFAHDVVMTPMDVVKQRLQLGRYRGVLDAFGTIYRTEGAGAFYRSFGTTLLMNLPYGCVMVAVNEELKRYMYPSGDYEIPGLMLSGAVAGGVAAAVTTPLDMIKTRLQTEQLEASNGATRGSQGRNAKTGTAPSRSASAVAESRRYLFTPAVANVKAAAAAPPQAEAAGMSLAMRFPMVDMAARILREEGALAFFRGMAPRVMVSAPSVAVSWTVYETMKSVLGEAWAKVER